MENQLTTINNNVIIADSGINKTLLSYRMDSTKYPRIGAMSRDQAIFEMSKIVAEVFMDKGQRTDQVTIRYISTKVVDELRNDPNNKGTYKISFAEIKHIISRASNTDSNFVTPSVSSINQIVYKYIDGEGHELSKKGQELTKQIEQARLNNSPIQRLIENNANTMILKK